MYETDQTTTVAIMACRSCGTGLTERSKFCRSCGAEQIDSSTPSRILMTADCVDFEPLRLYSTTRLSKQALYHPVSGPLVNAVVAGVPAHMPLSPASSASKKVLLALMAIPIWVMIILLSPLDAFASARIIGNRI